MAGWRDYARLTVLFNPDRGSRLDRFRRELIAEMADQHDVVLSCEPTDRSACGQERRAAARRQRHRDRDHGGEEGRARPLPAPRRSSAATR